MVRGWDLLGADITNARLQPHTVLTLDVFTPGYRYTVLIAQRRWMHFHPYFDGPWDEVFVYMSTLESAMIHAKNRSSCHLLPAYVQRRIDLVQARRRVCTFQSMFPTAKPMREDIRTRRHWRLAWMFECAKICKTSPIVRRNRTGLRLQPHSLPYMFAGP
jgi:hypothetical protein